jgi:predicted ATPase
MCKKEFKNTPHGRFFFENDKYYVCSGECKSKIAIHLKNKKKENNKIEKINQLIEAMPVKIQAPSAEELRTQVEWRVTEFIDNHKENKVIQKFKRNLIRMSLYSGSEDLANMLHHLRMNENDAFHAQCDMEMGDKFNYLKARYCK